MSTITLAEASKLSQDDLVAGVIENIVTVNPLFQLLPFSTVMGNAKKYNRELALGDAEFLGIGDVITAKSGATYTSVTSSLTTLLGDAEVNGLLTASGVGGENLLALQVASKAKSIGRSFQEKFITGDSTGTDEFDGLIKLISAGQKIALDGALTFDALDELIMKVTSKGDQVDFLMVSGRDYRKIRALNRALGGTDATYTTLAGIEVMYYAGVAVFRNDWIPTDAGVGSDESVIYAGNFDDGSEKVGIAGLTSAVDSGIVVQDLGASETRDEQIVRVKFYCGLASYSNLGLAALTGVQG